MSKTWFKVIISILVLLISSFIVLCVIKYNYPSFDFIVYLAGASNFFVAILTVFYVFTTSKQFEVMNEQLNEMKIERKLSHQPIPILENIIFKIEKPQFYFVPPFNEYSFQSRYFVESGLSNVSSSAALCVDIKMAISLRDEDEIKYLPTTIHRHNILPSGKQPLKNEVSIMFAGDNSAKFFSAIREEQASKYPKLHVSIIYKSTFGGYFLSKNQHYILPDDNKEDVIKEWHSHIAQFQVKYKNQITELKELSPQSDKWDNLFESVNSELALLFVSKDDIVNLRVVEIPGKFQIFDISEQEYNKIIDKNQYPRLVGRKSECKH